MRISGQIKPRRKKHSGLSFLFFVIILIAALAVWMDFSMRPAIENIAEHQAKVLATRLINEAMLAQMERSDVRYDELVRVTRGENGDITSIEANMSQINRLKSQMSDSVIQSLEESENRQISLPLGTVIGNQFTSGRGPLIEIKVVPTGYVQSEIFNHFSSAGINQTLHQIMLRITVQMVVVLPGYIIPAETETNFCIAETVIVGEIPQGYASLGGERPTFAPVRPD